MVAEHGCDMPWRAPQEQVSERICEQIVDVQMVKLLNTETQDRIQQRTAEQIVNTSVPQVA